MIASATSQARTRTAYLASAIAMSVCCAAMASDPGAFRTMGSLPNTNSSWGYGISNDGAHVVGRSGTNFYYGNASHGYCWKSSDGSITDVTPLDPDGTAWGISGDGSQIVGVRRTGSGGAHSFTCDNIGTDTSDSGGSADELFGISTDGSTSVGYSMTGGNPGIARAQIWTDAGRWEFIDSSDLSDIIGSRAYAVNANGSVVVGQATFDGIGARAFRWTRAGGMVNLGASTGGAVSDARGVSADGSVVVGASGYRAMRWTAADGVQELGTLPGGTTSTAFGISADGATIVGSVYIPADLRYHAFIWKTGTGMLDLQTVLAGVIPAGWRLVEARATTANGTKIVGTALNTLNEPQAFLATLPGPCHTDFNTSGTADVADIFDFLSSWFAGEPRANFNSQSAIDVQDIFDFLAAWFTGC